MSSRSLRYHPSSLQPSQRLGALSGLLCVMLAFSFSAMANGFAETHVPAAPVAPAPLLPAITFSAPPFTTLNNAKKHSDDHSHDNHHSLNTLLNTSGTKTAQTPHAPANQNTRRPLTKEDIEWLIKPESPTTSPTKPSNNLNTFPELQPHNRTQQTTPKVKTPNTAPEQQPEPQLPLQPKQKKKPLFTPTPTPQARPNKVFSPYLDGSQKAYDRINTHKQQQTNTKHSPSSSSSSPNNAPTPYNNVKQTLENTQTRPTYIKKPDLTELKATVSAPATLLLDRVAFYYKLDSDARFYAMRSDYEKRTQNGVTLFTLDKLALKAYEKAKIEERFTIWLDQGGPNPLIFRPKIHLRNNAADAKTNVSLRVTLQGNVGDLLVDPDLLITDYRYLNKTAHWETLYQETVTVDVLAPGEEKLVEGPVFKLFEFIATHKNRWPKELKVKAELIGGAGGSKTSILKMIPDHFITPIKESRRLTQ